MSNDDDDKCNGIHLTSRMEFDLDMSDVMKRDNNGNPIPLCEEGSSLSDAPNKEVLIVYNEQFNQIVDIRTNPFYKKSQQLHRLHGALIRIDRELAALHTILKLKTTEEDTYEDIRTIMKEKLTIRDKLNVKYKKMEKEFYNQLNGYT